MTKENQNPKEALKALQRLEEQNKVENMVKDNKIIFTVNDKRYRLRMPTLEEQEEISNVHRKKKIQFMNDDSYLTRKVWIEKYKNKGIDIEAKEREVRKLQADIKSSLLKLAQTDGKEAVKRIEDEINNLKEKQIEISVEITELLTDCLESQLRIFIDSYTAHLVLERKEEDKWIKHFKNYDEFNKCEDVNLISALFYYYDVFIYGVR
jgi:hypothetical protein